MKPVIILLSFLTLLASCSVEKRAQRKLKKAIELDPNIVTTVYTETTIKDTIRFKDTIKIPEKKLIFVTDNSLQNIIDEATRKRDSAITLYEDTKNKVEYWKDKADKDNFKIVTGKGGDTVFIDKPVPYEKTVTVPGKQITVTNNVKGFFWWFGLVICILLGLGLILKLVQIFSPSSFLGSLFKSK